MRHGLLLAALALSGCPAKTEVRGPTIRLEIDAEADVPAQLDQLHVQLAAQGDESDVFCDGGGTFLFKLEGAADLPVRIDLEPGDVFAERLAYRVKGRREGSTVFVREGNASWPESGRAVVPVLLAADCYGDDCVEGQHCCGPDESRCVSPGYCEPVPIPGIFDLGPGGGDCGLVGPGDGD